MIEVAKQIGQQIRVARKAKGLTLKEVAQRLGVSETTVSKYEIGSQNLTIETLKKIADALGMEFGVFFK